MLGQLERSVLQASAAVTTTAPSGRSLSRAPVALASWGVSVSSTGSRSASYARPATVVATSTAPVGYTGIASPVGGDGTFVHVDTPDGSLITLRPLPESQVIPSAMGVWGVGVAGAYVDSSGASVGEAAALGYDVMGAGSGIACLFLETVTDPVVMWEMVRERLSRPSDGVDAPVHVMPPLRYPERVELLPVGHAMPPLEHPERVGPLVSAHAMAPLAYPEVK